MFKRLNKNYLILVISIAVFCFCSFASEAGAYLERDIIISPNPAKTSEDIQIKITASDPNEIIYLIDFAVLKKGSNVEVESGSYDCTNDTNVPVSSCEKTFIIQLPEGEYDVVGFIGLKVLKPTDPESIALDKKILTVNESGSFSESNIDSPIITDIKYYKDASISISGLKFCSIGNDFGLSKITVYFDQSSSGGVKDSTNPIAPPNSTCETLYVKVPSTIIPDKDMDIIVGNTNGFSESRTLSFNELKDNPDGYSYTHNLHNYGLQATWPASPFGTSLEAGSIVILIKYIYEWLVSLGGFAVFVVLIIAGIQYLTSSGNSGKMKSAMDRITSAVMGLVLLLGSFIILNTINPQLTQLKEPSLPSTANQEWGGADIDLQIESKPCEKVELYTNEGLIVYIYGDPIEKNWDSTKTITSIKIAGGCQVLLYRLASFSTNNDNPYVSVPVSVNNFKGTYGVNTFRSIRISQLE
jgi:hypothetical protein